MDWLSSSIIKAKKINRMITQQLKLVICHLLSHFFDRRSEAGFLKIYFLVILELWKMHFSSQFGDLHW